MWCQILSDLISNEASFQSILLIYSGLYQWEVFLEYWSHSTVTVVAAAEANGAEDRKFVTKVVNTCVMTII